MDAARRHQIGSLWVIVLLSALLMAGCSAPSAARTAYGWAATPTPLEQSTSSSDAVSTAESASSTTLPAATVTPSSSAGSTSAAGTAPSPSDTPDGNTPGNIANGGYAAQAGEWVFYSDDTEKGIYRMADDSSKKIQLNADSGAFLNVYGQSLYYCNQDMDGRIFRMDFDGKSRLLLVDQPCSELVVHQDYLYYLEKSDQPRLMKAALDGSNAQPLYSPKDRRLQSFSLQGNNILVYSVQDNPDEASREQWYSKHILELLQPDGSPTKKLESLDYVNGGGGYFDHVQLAGKQAYAVYWEGGTSSVIHAIDINSGKVTRQEDPSQSMYLTWNAENAYTFAVTMDVSMQCKAIGAKPGSAKGLSVPLDNQQNDTAAQLCIAGKHALIRLGSKMTLVEIQKLKPSATSASTTGVPASPTAAASPAVQTCTKVTVRESYGNESCTITVQGYDKSGKRMWSRKWNSDSTELSPSTPAVLSNGKAYLVVAYKLTALDANTGKTLWQTKAGAGFCQPAIHGDTLYTSEYYGALLSAYSAKTGKLLFYGEEPNEDLSHGFSVRVTKTGVAVQCEYFDGDSNPQMIVTYDFKGKFISMKEK